MAITVMANTILMAERKREQQILLNVLQQSKREARMTVLMGRSRCHFR